MGFKLDPTSYPISVSYTSEIWIGQRSPTIQSFHHGASWCQASPDIKTGSPHIKELTTLPCEALVRFCATATHKKKKKSDYYSNNFLVPQTTIHLLSVAQGLWTKRHWVYFSKITHGKKMELLPAQHGEKGTVRSEGKCNSLQCSQICGYLWHSCGKKFGIMKKYLHTTRHSM